MSSVSSRASVSMQGGVSSCAYLHHLTAQLSHKQVAVCQAWGTCHVQELVFTSARCRSDHMAMKGQLVMSY